MAVEVGTQVGAERELSADTQTAWDHLIDTAKLYERYLELSRVGQFPLPEDRVEDQEIPPRTGMPLTLEIHTHL